MKTSFLSYTTAAITTALFSTSALAMGPATTTLAPSGSSASPVQSSADPFHLSIVEPVQAAGSDTASAGFDDSVLQPTRTFLNQTLQPGIKYNDSLHYLDPSKLRLTTAADTRVYFVGEGAGYHNSLGVNTTGTGVSSGDPKLMFPDASSPVSTAATSWDGVRRTASEPLLPGDFVDLGTNAAGTLLNFFLISNGANGGTHTFSTDRASNPDAINHVVAFTTPGSPYLMIGFEDMWGGGDRDFNDELIAVDIGAANLKALAAAPEPAMWLVLASFLAPVIWLKRRRAASAGSDLDGMTMA